MTASHSTQMHAGLGLALALALAGCSPPPGATRGPGPAQPRPGTAIALQIAPSDQPPALPPGACQDYASLPTVIETISEQVLVSAEERAPDGRLLKPASYSTQTHQRIIQDRHDVWFRVPCPEVWSVNFIASLQRALKARGFFLAPISGEYDPATAEAVRRFQELRGLDSTTLSLAAAQELGIASVEAGP